MIVYKYEIDGTDCIMRLDELLEAIQNDIECQNYFPGEIDLHIEVLEMTEEEFDALPLSDEAEEDPDLIYHILKTKTSREFIGAHRGAAWAQDAKGVYQISLYYKAGVETHNYRHGSSVQMEKADDICKLWVTTGRVSASFVPDRSKL